LSVIRFVVSISSSAVQLLNDLSPAGMAEWRQRRLAVSSHLA